MGIFTFKPKPLLLFLKGLTQNPSCNRESASGLCAMKGRLRKNQFPILSSLGEASMVIHVGSVANYHNKAIAIKTAHANT